jgi:aromatic ring-opening dioxygenase LigB subunit
MALTFAAFTPHTPLIIPHIGKEHVTLLEKTTESFEYLANELYASRPDTLIVISAHAQLLPEAFTINLSPAFNISFHDFGDVVTALQFRGDVGFAHHLKERLETSQQVIMSTNEDLDHGIGVPLFKLLEPFGKNPPKLIPIMYSLLSFEHHFSFGVKLQQEILNSTKRIAVLASGELSHRLTKKSPAGYSPKGAEFDNQIKDLLEKNQTKKLLELKPSFVEEAGECGFRSLLILLGILNSMNYSTKMLSYEAPFGIGYLTSYFPLS